ncbi:Aminobutyraldehyde dehydrogenase [Scedosporium apiospermum]|uniref:Aminobutyraldehyde dehydrogenase n=1 Tax=Pseudallescheria apiosperma TaxID=563466 RepID=A0A084G6Z1_PSEDA|nr:Aminobutyraldehyde dehydrogenase [Scedosporium apiospermum]KEZ43103.1 Aminobutyraldehyde dehydrogenase [Scedosporium apiospermum]
MDQPSIYVGKGPGVDKAWEAITGDVGDQMVSKDEALRLGLAPDSMTIKHPVTGVEGFRVGMEVFHQLHCLNLLRQFSFKEYYSHTGGDVETDEEDLRGHSDIGVFSFRHFEGSEGHWPDYATTHTCRNFDKIREWATENAVALTEAGLPAGCINFLPCSPERAPEITGFAVKHPKVRHINFTGSERTIIAGWAASCLKKCVFKLGGKAPVIVRQDANIDDAVEAIVFGGLANNEGVTRDMDLDHKESFGPVMILIEFETDESAVQLANDSEFSLCASIFSCNVMRAMDLAKEIRASSCHMNGPTVYIEPTLPNGGVGGSSGYGRFGGISGVEEFTERKIISLAQPGMKYNF